MSTQETDQAALRRRWRLMLGSEADNLPLAPADVPLERTLGALYDRQDGRGSLHGSAPNVARWLGDIREYFPASVVQVMQQDAMERLGLQQMLLEPEMLRSVQADVHLVATLLSLNRLMPSKTKDTARQVVRGVVEQLERKLGSPLRQAVSGSLNRAARNHRPRHNEIDWLRTIRANLRHYQADYQTIIAERRVGFARKSQSLRDIVLCVDQSGSMAPSVVYASVFAAVLASIKSVSTQVVVFDTAVVDLTPLLADPVEVLFGTQLGGGTDIDQALAYCQGLVKRPQETIFVLISDLYEGGNAKQMLARARAMVDSGVQMIALLALDDHGAPSYDHRHAAQFAAMGIPCFACTPDKFPDLMAAAIKKQDMAAWAAQNDIAVAA
ncbi:MULTISPECIES: VWA domain-containing protein [Rugamonas]|uniref:VWA domain containing CoxE-like protein n=1 Tax=Rugamonas rubra TaxID=758825 RepID=A0A1I4NCK8_9BURK|nr:MULTISPECIES: VWA domain-containing protein [Rugamonas]WGG48857.1 VWA domain-containing protein [Rugamonas sp. DEMB1]SFM13302.1 VWA domain containing CoxE-like protein [Rugamonas rubra]